MEVLRRFLAVAAAAAWLGGFAFYTAVVIPAGHDALGDATDVGFITRIVMARHHWVASAALAVLLWNLAASWREAGRLRWGLGATWALAAASVPALFLLHAALSATLDPASRTVFHRERFDVLHDRYEFAATLQWLAGLVHLAFVIPAWRRLDRPH